MPPAPCTSGSTMMRGDLVARAARACARSASALSSSRGRSTTYVLRQQPAKQRVHAVVGVAHRHRAGGVAVIAARKATNLCRAAHAAIEPVLHRHLHRDLDRDRAGFGEEHAVEIARQQRRQPPRQRQRLLVHQPAEHHVRHARQAGARPRRGCADGCSRGRRSTTRRCRRSVRGRRRARCGCPRCGRPAAAAARSSSAHRAARRGRARPGTRRANSPRLRTSSGI